MNVIKIFHICRVCFISIFKPSVCIYILYLFIMKHEHTHRNTHWYHWGSDTGELFPDSTVVLVLVLQRFINEVNSYGSLCWTTSANAWVPQQPRSTFRYWKKERDVGVHVGVEPSPELTRSEGKWEEPNVRGRMKGNNVFNAFNV